MTFPIVAACFVQTPFDAKTTQKFLLNKCIHAGQLFDNIRIVDCIPAGLITLSSRIICDVKTITCPSLEKHILYSLFHGHAHFIESDKDVVYLSIDILLHFSVMIQTLLCISGVSVVVEEIEGVNDIHISEELAQRIVFSTPLEYSITSENNEWLLQLQLVVNCVRSPEWTGNRTIVLKSTDSSAWIGIEWLLCTFDIPFYHVFKKQSLEPSNQVHLIHEEELLESFKGFTCIVLGDKEISGHIINVPVINFNAYLLHWIAPSVKEHPKITNASAFRLYAHWLQLYPDNPEKATEYYKKLVTLRPETTRVEWNDVGGLDSIKHKIIKILSSDRMRGILLHGPPGTGKTLVAKAIATHMDCSFISIKGPELLSPFVGESEKNIMRVFEQARGAKPCVLFFDEIDSIIPRRGGGGVMDRITSAFLSHVEGEGIVVIAATNRIDLLDPSALRPGRFDTLLEVPLPSKEGLVQIMKAQLRKVKLACSVDEVLEMVEKLPKGTSGADVSGIVKNAVLDATLRTCKQVEEAADELGLDAKELAKDPKWKVDVTLKDFQSAFYKFGA